MESEDVVVFCENELPRISFTAFENMREKGRFCDLTIKVQNHSFTAHRMILAAGIPYFQSVFENSAMDNGEKEFAVEDLDPRALESLIHFAYTSKVIITNENVNSLLVASQFLQLDQVRDACVGFLSNRLRIDTVIQVRTLACSLNNSKLTKNCDLYIRNNFEEFSKCDDFLSLPDSCFKEIIADDDLMVSSEEIVFDAVIKWTKVSPSERHGVLSELLNEVRLIYLPIDYFIERVDYEELILSSEACRNLVKEVKTYHMLPERRPAFSNLKMRPRSHFRHDLYAFCSCTTCGYSVHRLVNEKWITCSSKKVHPNKIICVVGVNEKIYIVFDKTIETFCIKTCEWDKLITTHRDRTIKGAAVVSNEDKIYCFGAGESAFAQQMSCFDTKLNEWLQDVQMETPRRDCAAASLEESIYVTGGYTGAGAGGRINTVEKFTPSSAQWSKVAPMLTERDEHGCTSLGRKIYVCGGQTSGGVKLNTAEMYDPVTNQWNYIPAMVNAKNFFTLVSHDNRMYALGKSDAEAYDPKDNEWKSVLRIPDGFVSAVSIRAFR